MFIKKMRFFLIFFLLIYTNNLLAEFIEDLSKIIVTVQSHGNTSAASIPLAISVANKEKKLKKGDLLLTEAIGGGLAWGSVIFRW